jgi:hypothetical protein
MSKDNVQTKTIDEILNTSTRYIHQYGCACTKLKKRSDCDCKPYDTLAEAKQQIAQLLDYVIGEDEKPSTANSSLEKQLFPDARRLDYRQSLRAQQRLRCNEVLGVKE